jgi:hypothetical protein
MTCNRFSCVPPSTLKCVVSQDSNPTWLFMADKIRTQPSNRGIGPTTDKRGYGRGSKLPTQEF